MQHKPSARKQFERRLSWTLFSFRWSSLRVAWVALWDELVWSCLLCLSCNLYFCTSLVDCVVTETSLLPAASSPSSLDTEGELRGKTLSSSCLYSLMDAAALVAVFSVLSRNAEFIVSVALWVLRSMVVVWHQQNSSWMWTLKWRLFKNFFPKMSHVSTKRSSL